MSEDDRTQVHLPAAEAANVGEDTDDDDFVYDVYLAVEDKEGDAQDVPVVEVDEGGQAGGIISHIKDSNDDGDVKVRQMSSFFMLIISSLSETFGSRRC
jgi:hypothetical protein